MREVRSSGWSGAEQPVEHDAQLIGETWKTTDQK